MPNPGLTPEQRRPIIEALAKGKDCKTVAEETRRSWKAVKNIQQEMIAIGGASMLGRPLQPGKPRYTVSTDRRATSEKVRLVYWTDSHDSPRIKKDRFRWIGRYVASVKPDLVIHGGDSCTFDSLCRYDGNETLRGKEKPSYEEDIDSLKSALEWYRDGLSAYSCPHHITLGNHEDRVLSFMNRNPELAGLIDTHLYTVFEQAGWTYSPFGQLHFVAGAAFVHAPFTTMGKPYGGMYAENQIARDSLETVFFGHSHKRLCKSYSKSLNRQIYVVNGGCSLPEGHVERYAQHSLTGWTYGIYDVTLQAGNVNEQWIPMRRLEEEFA